MEHTGGALRTRERGPLLRIAVLRAIPTSRQRQRRWPQGRSRLEATITVDVVEDKVLTVIDPVIHPRVQACSTSS